MTPRSGPCNVSRRRGSHQLRPSTNTVADTPPRPTAIAYDPQTSRVAFFPLTGTNRLRTSVKLRLARLVRNIIVVINELLMPTTCDEYWCAAIAQYNAPNPDVANVDATSAYALRCNGARRCSLRRRE